MAGLLGISKWRKVALFLSFGAKSYPNLQLQYFSENVCEALLVEKRLQLIIYFVFSK